MNTDDSICESGNRWLIALPLVLPTVIAGAYFLNGTITWWGALLTIGIVYTLLLGSTVALCWGDWRHKQS